MVFLREKIGCGFSCSFLLFMFLKLGDKTYWYRRAVHVRTWKSVGLCKHLQALLVKHKVKGTKSKENFAGMSYFGVKMCSFKET